MTDAEKEIREALAAGPTPGEWFAVNDGTRGEPFMNVKAERISGRGPTHEVAICATGDSPQSMETANARYIAACHPAAIRELLAEIERLRADAERMDFMEINGLGCDKLGSLGYFVYHNCIQYHGTTARAAIDAARGKE